MKLDTLTPYTTHRLCQWGAEIRGGGTWLGLPSVNMLHRDHSVAGCARRVSISDEAWVTELVVNEIRKELPDAAVVLRACYCGNGRWTEERRRYAERLIGHALSRHRFWKLHDAGFSMVRDFFAGLLRLAA